MYNLNTPKANELIENINHTGINYIAQNLEFLGIYIESDTSVRYQFSDGISIIHTGYSASSMGILETKVVNSENETLLLY